MKKTFKSRSALLLAGVIAATLVAGCSDTGKNNASQPPASAPEASASGGQKSLEPITLDLYSDRAWYSDWTGPGAKRISEKTGVSFNVKKPVQDDSDGKDISLMIASNSLPDLMVVDRGNKMLDQLIEGDYLYAIDELIDQYAPNLRTILDEQYGPELLTKFAETDGHTYKLVSGYQTEKYLEQAQKNAGLAPVWLPQLVVRKDYYDEIGRPDTSSPEKFLAALEQMAEKHPDKIPYLGDKSQHSGDLGWFSSQFGVEPYYVDGDEVKNTIYDPKWKEMIKYGFQLASKGLLTKESFVNSKDVTSQKVAAGDSIVWAYNSTAVNSTPPKDNPNTQFEVLTPFADYMYPTIPRGWMALVIPKSNKDPERTIKLLEYAASKEGQIDFSFGVEGKGADDFKDLTVGPHFYYDTSVKNDYFPNGKPALTTGFNDALNNDWGGSWKQAGLGEPIMLITNWAVSNTVFWNPSDEKKVAYDKMMAPKMKFFPEFDFKIDSTSEFGIIEAKINTLREDYMPKLVFAQSESEFEALFADMLKAAEGLGVNKLAAEYTRQYAVLKAETGNS
ncbi:extracellular solute-binding protein [Paenibacillus sp. LHD-117]|uniref:extracellular solute-binding protein n=1 Tax=Paenibacillus sp. LHD-117 TaxID=3071412 RepID=UPI0027E066A0|nr:extracellular solute-binding protein [Paenibacillus sp. LHD-117]MDQ6421467.1 extracellular solute-binding protein [Paenibacillus sp. LHD-117]